MITLTTTGVNSAVLEYTNGETYTNLMIQVNAFIVAHG